ncbi:4-hydroxy-3-methylbut-2-enyl diphosphate reductase, partial [bacterium]|nr:4-hydroxy-3-methylbut-2-enyl diphosphate reductase [bacterium]
MSKNVKLAKFAGFCYGVKRAVETVKKLKLENPDKKIFVLGELIHNSQVIKELEELGIKTVDVLPENETGICVIRSHGASPQVIEDIQKRGFELVDLTCPDVKKVQQHAIQLAKEGDYVIIVGKAEHPEVIAIKANAEQYTDK